MRGRNSGSVRRITLVPAIILLAAVVLLSLGTAAAAPDSAPGQPQGKGKKPTSAPTATATNPPSATQPATFTPGPTLTATSVPTSTPRATNTPLPTVAPTSVPSSPGLVAAYSFNEGTGATVADASGNGNDGTVNGASWTPQGRTSSALAFDGSSSRVVVSDSPSLDLGADLTLEAWVYPTSLGGWRNVILKEQSGGLTYGLYANTDTSRPAGYIYISGELDVRGSAGLPLNTWTHLATTHDGASLRLYVNGSLVATRSAPGAAPDSSGPLQIGGNAVWGEYFSGRIDEVRVYNRALSQQEIQADMNAPVGSLQPAPPTPTSAVTLPTATSAPATTATLVPTSMPLPTNTPTYAPTPTSTAVALPVPTAMPGTADEVIDQVAVLTNITGASDIQAELEELVAGLVADPNDYNGFGYQYERPIKKMLYFRGRITTALAPLIPLLPGSVGDASTLKGKLAARLKTEVQSYLLNQKLWDFEYAARGTTLPSWVTPWPNTVLSSVFEWNHRYRSGPHWEKFYAIWAYAYYTGDWTTVQNGLAFLKARYSEGDQTKGNQRYYLGNKDVYRYDPVRLAQGLIGFARILDHFNDPMETQVRSQARTALGYVSDPAFVNHSITASQFFTGWDNISSTGGYDYPACESIAPETGRWLSSTSLSYVAGQVNAALSNTALKEHYNGNMFNTGGGRWPTYHEEAWGSPYIGNQLFACRAYVTGVSAETLRQEIPWPAIMGRIPKYRDMNYIQSLYGVLYRSSTVSWREVEPN